MKKMIPIIAAVLTSGCALMADDSYMPSESQVAWKDPTLQNCPNGKPPVCDNWTGSRIHKRLINCRCWR